MTDRQFMGTDPNLFRAHCAEDSHDRSLENPRELWREMSHGEMDVHAEIIDYGRAAR